MATRALIPDAAPLDLLLGSVPSLPRAILARLTARMIERLDELDGDPDLEPDYDDTSIDDGPCDTDTDREAGSWAEDQLEYGINHTYGDDDREDDEPAARRAHCKRVGATICERIVRYGVPTFRLTGQAANVMGLQP